MTPSIQKFGRFFLFPFNEEKDIFDFLSSNKNNFKEIKTFPAFLNKLSCKYLLLVDAENEISMQKPSLLRLLKAFEDKRTGIVYSDFVRREGNHLIQHPLINYQPGSIRDDFQFGYLLIFSCAAIKSALQKYGTLPSGADAALYDLRLKISADHEITHVAKFLYVVSVKKQKQTKKTSGKAEAHFEYVARENFLRQKTMEKIATNHLKRIGAYLSPRMEKTVKEPDDSQWKASVVIPVLNRKKTIAAALTGALNQKTDFPFNIIVVDNHSTDGTTDILRKFAAKYPHVHHRIPARRDLGIGGCWNEAIYSPYCGRYVVQLDSDDLYSSPRTLQKIVDTMRRGRYAMVVGSYTIVNERLKKIPPGLIDHREWTRANGHNNLLRVNGMGAPRAFELSALRRIGFPDVSYGEDYAVALKMTREYSVGRIYENLYWCRRWKNNTDAGLSIERKNANDSYKDTLRTEEIEARKMMNQGNYSLDGRRIFAGFKEKKDVALPLLCQSLYDSQQKTWPRLASAVRDLDRACTRKLSGEYKIYLQYNPARAVSSGAAVDPESIKKRPCFLCQENLPVEQKGILYKNRYLILCNPAPIYKNHFTVVERRHKPQEIGSSINWLLSLGADLSPAYAVFYNGPSCGASAPDHLHFQAVPRKGLPFLRELKKLSPVQNQSFLRCSAGKISNRSVIVLEGKRADTLIERFLDLLNAVQKITNSSDEPMVNVICHYSGKLWKLIVFLRRKHRPDAYFAKGMERLFVSPGAVDMAGFVITPLLDNYRRLDYNAVQEIYREVSLSENVTNLIREEIQRSMT